MHYKSYIHFILRSALYELIDTLDLNKAKYVVNPAKDFKRKRKLDFKRLVRLMLTMGSRTISGEIENEFCETSIDPDRPSASAFVQQRTKIKHEAFEFLFREFVLSFSDIGHLKHYNGRRLYAADGSGINISRNPDDPDTFIQHCSKGYNQIHLNAMYDLLNCIYTDVLIQNAHDKDERGALGVMATRLPDPGHSIIIADRGYEGWRSFLSLISSGAGFIIRMKSPSSNGILSAYDFSKKQSYVEADGSFDVDIHTILTHKQTNEVKENPDKYTYVLNIDDIPELKDRDSPYCPISFRVVAVKLPDGKLEYLATNLEREEFSPDDLKYCYFLRWGIETSFRRLKYTLGLVNFHSRKKEFVLQEVYARLTFFNYCESNIQVIHVDQKDTNKHVYEIDFDDAVPTLRTFLKHRDNKVDDLVRLLQRKRMPVRPDRKYERKVKGQNARIFIYKAA